MVSSEDERWTERVRAEYKIQICAGKMNGGGRRAEDQAKEITYEGLEDAQKNVRGPGENIGRREWREEMKTQIATRELKSGKGPKYSQISLSNRNQQDW